MKLIFMIVMFTFVCFSFLSSGQSIAAEESVDLIKIPPALKAEHDKLHTTLEKAVNSGGKTAAAAEEVEQKLRPHFLEEEEYALPPLGLLVPLSEGQLDPQMADAIPLANWMQVNYKKMLREHEDIVQSLKKLASAARDEDKPEFAEFATDLILHAQNEEQVLYPAAILIGKYLKIQFPRTETAGSPNAFDSSK